MEPNMRVKPIELTRARLTLCNGREDCKDGCEECPFCDDKAFAEYIGANMTINVVA